MARGGKRTPGGGPTPPSGPGKFSKRSDAGKPPKTPGLDNTELQYGDVQRLRDAQSIAPVPSGGGGYPTPPPVPARVRGQVMDQGKVPDYLLSGGSNRPNEPVTAGLPMGAGPGPEALQASQATDVREAVLMYLQRNFNNEDAGRMLQQYRTPVAPPQPMMPPAAPAPDGGPDQAPPDTPIATDPNQTPDSFSVAPTP